MQIREQQMKQLRRMALQGYEDEMLVHLADFSPPLHATVGEAAMRAVIRQGIERARGYGFTLRGPVRLYLELMLLFGSRFDTDPQYYWCGRILADSDKQPEMARAQKLYAITMDYRRKVAGAADVHAVQALRKLVWFAREPLRLGPHDFEADMLEALQEIYPQKVAYVGPDALRALIAQGVEFTRAQGFTTVRQAALMIGLMFGFGHACWADPLYGWIANTLRQDRISGADERAALLEKKALTWLAHVLSRFDGPSGP